MIKTEEVTSTENRVTHLICDKCKIEVSVDDFMEYQEFVHISHACGFGSVFGDGTEFRLNICQRCAKDMFGDLVINLANAENR